MLRNTFLTLLAFGFILNIVDSQLSRANDSTVNDAKNSAGDASTNVKKTVRKGKRKLRKATGTDSVGKDIKDSANDVGDDMSNTGDKVKRKINK